MTRACNAKSVMLPHSLAKVEFYQRYLELYLIILSAAEFSTEINIYDLFCGRGEYDDGNLGSAIRAYETIMKVRREHPTKKPKPIILHLNDKNKAFVNNVQQYISSHYGSEPAPCKIVYSNQDAFELLEEIKEKKLKKQRLKPDPLLPVYRYRAPAAAGAFFSVFPRKIGLFSASPW